MKDYKFYEYHKIEAYLRTSYVVQADNIDEARELFTKLVFANEIGSYSMNDSEYVNEEILRTFYEDEKHIEVISIY